MYFIFQKSAHYYRCDFLGGIYQPATQYHQKESVTASKRSEEETRDMKEPSNVKFDKIPVKFRPFCCTAREKYTLWHNLPSAGSDSFPANKQT